MKPTVLIFLSATTLIASARLAVAAEKDKHVVGTNPQPGVYDRERERAGEDGFKPGSGSSYIDCTACLLGRDGFYIGRVGHDPYLDVTIVNAHIEDSGRQGIGAVNCEKVEVIGGVWGDGAGARHHIIDLEPLLPAAREKNGPGDRVLKFTFRGESQEKPLLVGKAGYFLIGSKGDPRCDVKDILIQDVVSLPDTTVGNIAWFAGSEQYVKGPLTFRRVSINVRHSIADTARIDPPAKSGRDKAYFFAWCDATLEDCWVNGRPITKDDVQWVGREPVIRTTGWQPPKVTAPPRLSPDQKNAEPARTYPLKKAGANEEKK